MHEAIVVLPLMLGIILGVWFVFREDTAGQRREREKLAMEAAEKERIRQQKIDNAKKSLSLAEAVEIAKKALSNLKTQNVRDSLAFLQSTSQIEDLIADYHRELIPIYEQLMKEKGLDRSLLSDEIWDKQLQYCMSFGWSALSKREDLRNPNIQPEVSETKVVHREIVKGASWEDLKKRNSS
jgi:hypothetical protein